MNYHKLTFPDVNNGLGCRVTLWLSGCSHHCPNCHNPHTWDFKSGREFTKEAKEKLFEILSMPYIHGLTLSGGDPADSPEEVIELCKEVQARFPDKNIWLYTGYTLEEIQADSRRAPLLESGISVVVDGLYVEKSRDITLPFRGSSNQRIWGRKEDGSFEVIPDAVFVKYI